jgi:catecholate siderophore receptor
VADRRRDKGKKKSPTKAPLEGKGAWPITYKWLAMGTIVAYTAVGGRVIKLSGAPQTPGLVAAHPGKSREPDSVAPRPFDIAPGSLGDIVPAFEQASGLHILTPEQGIRSIASSGVKGTYTSEQALGVLLAGTGIQYKMASPNLVSLRLRPVEQSVTVTGRAEDLNLTKYSQPILDSPQTISVVPQHIMQEQGTTTLRDALRNVAGISLAAGEGGSQGDNLTIRGFTARNDIFLDGMRDFGSYYRDPFDQESVAVLQGPSSAVFGRGSTGGVVSQISKTPRPEGFIAGSVDAGTDLTRRLTLDIDEPLRALGRNTAFRLNLMGDEANVADRNVTVDRRYGIAPTLEFGLGTPSRLTLSFLREWEDDIPDYGIPWFFNRPAPVPRQNYYGFTHGNFLETGDHVGTVKFEHDFAAPLSLRSQLRYANYPRDAVITEPQINAPNTPSTPLSQIVVTRNEIAVKSVESFLDDQTDASTSFHTGGFRHTFVAGIELGRETSDPTRFAFQNIPQTSLLAPNPNQAPPRAFTISSQVQTTAYTDAAYAIDTIDFRHKWELTGGFRWDRFRTDYSQSVAPASAYTRVDEMPSWRGALVYKPAANGSVYFDAGTSFNPSAETLSLSAANASLLPEKNLTLELGTKWEFFSDRSSLAASLFRTDQANAREPDPTNPVLNVLAGTLRAQGAEVEFSGRITDRWHLLSSYAFIPSEVVKSNYYPASVGYPLANVPKNTFNVWSTYQLPWRHFEVGGGANFVDSRTASSTVPLDPTTGLLKQVPGYWVANAMVGYRLSDRLDLQINAYNLANTYYYDEPHPVHIVPGAGRSVLVGLNFRLSHGRK